MGAAEGPPPRVVVFYDDDFHPCVNGDACKHRIVYLSRAEHKRLVAEERAKAFEEAADNADFRVQMMNAGPPMFHLASWCRSQAQAARLSGKEKGGE